MKSNHPFIMRFISFQLLFALVFFPHILWALPQGAEHVNGNNVVEVDGSTMNITTDSSQAITNWNSYSIGGAEAVHYHQPNGDSVYLNRVVGADPSNIFGTLTANGHIFLVNPNGVIFSPGARVDVAGLVASTLGISNADFLAGRYTFFGQGGKVVNQGYISAPGGYVALLGSSVENSGVIEANSVFVENGGVIEASLGSVALASGEAITLELDPQGLIQVVIDEATSQNLKIKPQP